jgi:hypothetical protein
MTAPNSSFTDTTKALRDKLASLKWHITENTVNKEILVDLIHDCQRLAGVAQAEKQPGWTNRPACSFPEMAPTPPVQDGKGEAVAWRTNTGGATTDKRIAEIWRDKYHFTIEPLYAAPPPASNAGGGTWEPADFWKFVSGLAGEFEADQMRDMLAQSGLQVVGSRDPAYTPSARLARAERALAIISYMSAQCGGDAMKMRDIATDVTLWDRPDSMWWHGKDYGPSVPSTEGKSHD